MTPSHKLSKTKPRQDTIWSNCIEANCTVAEVAILHLNEFLFMSAPIMETRQALKIVLSSSQNSQQASLQSFDSMFSD